MWLVLADEEENAAVQKRLLLPQFTAAAGVNRVSCCVF